MIDLQWLQDRLCEVVAWQLANPGSADGPEVPWAGRRVWSLFLRLNESRSAGGFGPSPITYEAMDAFSAITGEPLRPWEIDIIRALDREWLRIINGGENPGQAIPASHRSAMSTAAFDAVFE